MKDQERDQLRRCILELLQQTGPLRYTVIEKKVVASYMAFATSNTVENQLCSYLVVYGFVERISRGMYKITLKGERLLESLSK